MSEVPVSVIVPTCHRNDVLAKCLDCLAPGVQTLPSDQYEVIVTDDGSQDTAEQMIHQRYPLGKVDSRSRAKALLPIEIMGQTVPRVSG